MAPAVSRSLQSVCDELPPGYSGVERVASGHFEFRSALYLW